MLHQAAEANATHELRLASGRARASAAWPRWAPPAEHPCTTATSSKMRARLPIQVSWFGWCEGPALSRDCQRSLPPACRSTAFCASGGMCSAVLGQPFGGHEKAVGAELACTRAFCLPESREGCRVLTGNPWPVVDDKARHRRACCCLQAPKPTRKARSWPSPVSPRGREKGHVALQGFEHRGAATPAPQGPHDERNAFVAWLHDSRAGARPGRAMLDM